jgi:predicted nucleic-acid-binding Zn-ribbon protein
MKSKKETTRTKKDFYKIVHRSYENKISQIIKEDCKYSEFYRGQLSILKQILDDIKIWENATT